MAFKVSPIRAFSDNYIWAIDNDGSGVSVVDPGDAAPVLDAVHANSLSLSSILVTHHHADHTGGIKALLAEFPDTPVYGPRSNKIDSITHPLNEGDVLNVSGIEFAVISVPGHTLDHIAYFAHGDSGKESVRPALLFCGDTLFSGGCGRIFEGNPYMMYESLEKLASLPGTTMVYCAHEYTLGNLRFAMHADPFNQEVIERLQQVIEILNAGIPTVPSVLSIELRTNPFLRCHTKGVRKAVTERMEIAADCSDIDVFAALRRWKDCFSI